MDPVKKPQNLAAIQQKGRRASMLEPIDPSQVQTTLYGKVFLSLFRITLN